MKRLVLVFALLAVVASCTGESQFPNATGKGTITNMGAELGATTSVFPLDERIAAYLTATDRAQIARLAERHAKELTADPVMRQFALVLGLEGVCDEAERGSPSCRPVPLVSNDALD